MSESQLINDMSRHEGVSCDNCLMSNFDGKRFKCLICYDYDLCKRCHDMDVTTSRHLASHAMQCILTRNDYELYYGGENITPESPPSFVCPFCTKLGFTESLLHEHVTKDHANIHTEVVCPICAALPSGDPNLVTDDLAAHLTMEHRTPRDVDDPVGGRHIRRMFYPGRGLRQRNHRTMNFTGGSSAIPAVGTTSSNNNTSASVSTTMRDSMDPIAELLSQLSGVRRSAQQLQQTVTTASQLQELQSQLQLERQRAAEIRQQVPLERFPNKGQVGNGTSQGISVHPAIGAAVIGSKATSSKKSSSNVSEGEDSRYLLSCLDEPNLSESEREKQNSEDVERAQFVQELLLSLLSSHPSDSQEQIDSQAQSSPRPLAVEPAVPADCPLLASTPSHAPGGSSGPDAASSRENAKSEQCVSFNSSNNRNDDTGVGNSVLADDVNSPPGGALLVSSSEHQRQQNQAPPLSSGAVSSRSAPVLGAGEQQRKAPEWGFREPADRKDSDDDSDKAPSPTPSDQHRALTLQGRVLVTGGSPIGLHGNREEVTSSGLSKHVR